MPRRPRLVALDVDGTLLTTDLRLTDRARRAVSAVASSGVAVALASARAPAEVETLLVALPGVSLLVALQGAWVGRWGDPPEPFVERRLSLASARRVTAAAVERGLDVGWFWPESWAVREASDAVRRHARITGLEPSIVRDLMAGDVAPHKLTILADDPSLEAAVAGLATTLPDDCVGFRSHPDYFEVTATGVDKGTGLRLLLDGLGLVPADVLAVGDGDNDVDLLLAAGRAVAMANATPAALSAAAEVTASNDEDGVAILLERVFGLDPAGAPS